MRDETMRDETMHDETIHDETIHDETITLERIAAQLDRMERQLDALTRSQRAQQELIDELTPIGKEVMHVASARLEDWERRGFFAFGREGLGLIEEVMDRFGPEDVHLLRENIVTILEVVRQITRPRMMTLVSQVTSAVEDDPGEGVGLMGMLRASHDVDTRRGLAATLAVLRELGRGVAGVASQRSGGQERLSRHLAATRQPDTPASGLHARLAPSRPTHGRPPHEKVAPREERSAPSRTSSAPTAPSGAVAGLEVDAQGFLVDPAAWTPEYAAAAAASLGISALTEAHWSVIIYMRDTYTAQGKTPNIRAISAGAGVPTKDIYALFLKTPGLTAARIAGVPKPVGCI